uniref:Uncharacterized protein n=1 Tax=viral metagenome TaxID=1070528 RepID=A0A6C0KRD3_9ZZZZ
MILAQLTVEIERTYSFHNQINISGGDIVPGPPAQNSAITFCSSVRLAAMSFTASISASRSAPVEGDTES